MWTDVYKRQVLCHSAIDLSPATVVYYVKITCILLSEITCLRSQLQFKHKSLNLNSGGMFESEFGKRSLSLNEFFT